MPEDFQRPLTDFQGMNLGGETPLPAPGSLTQTMQNPKQSRRQAVNEFTSNLMYTLSKSFAASASAPGNRGKLAAVSAALAAPGERKTMIAEQEAASEKLKADREQAQQEREKKDLEMQKLRQDLNEQFDIVVINGRLIKKDKINHTIEDVTPASAERPPEVGKEVPYPPEVIAQQVRKELALREKKDPPHREIERGGRKWTQYYEQGDPSKVTYEVDAGPADAKTGSTAKPDYIWVKRGGDPLYLPESMVKPGDIPYDVKGGGGKTDAEAKADLAEQYSAERAQRTIAAIKDLQPRVGWMTVGPIAGLLRKVYNTNAIDFETDIKPLAASIAFTELNEMKNASVTGGALGQVSVIELQLLESALGSISADQSPGNFKRNLLKIKASIERWQEAKKKLGGSGGGGATGGGSGSSIDDEINALMKGK